MANYLWVVELYDVSSGEWNPMIFAAWNTCSSARELERQLKQADELVQMKYKYRIRKYRRDEASRG